ncbi:MAG: extracellular solute-binding protein [Nitriliruptorales bacterium]
MKRARLLMVLAVLALLAAACGGGAEPQADTAQQEPTDVETEAETEEEADAEEVAVSGTVLIYTSVPQPIIDELKARFEAALPGLTLEVFRAKTGEVTARIATEQQAGEVQADVIWVAEPSTYEAFKETGLLAAYDPPADAPIPDAYVDPEGFYVAGRIINMIVAWNTDALPDGLGDWSDLNGGDVKAAFPGPGSGSAMAAIAALIDTSGEDFFRAFADAGGVQVSSNGAARDGLIAGEFEAAGVLDYMIRGAKAEGSPVDLAYPSSGTVVIPSPLAITSSSKNPDGAKAFVDFVLSQEGQQAVVEIGDFYPARTDVDPPAGAPALDSVAAIDLDWKDLAQRQDEIDEYWRSIFGG